MNKDERNTAIRNLVEQLEHTTMPRKVQYTVVVDWLIVNETLPWKAHISIRQFYRIIQGMQKPDKEA